MTRTSTLRFIGVLSIALAVIGSLTSFSAVLRGGPDGAAYLIVNITLVVLGAVLLWVAARGRRDVGHVSSETSADVDPASK